MMFVIRDDSRVVTIQTLKNHLHEYSKEEIEEILFKKSLQDVQFRNQILPCSETTFSDDINFDLSKKWAEMPIYAPLTQLGELITFSLEVIRYLLLNGKIDKSLSLLIELTDLTIKSHKKHIPKQFPTLFNELVNSWKKFVYEDYLLFEKRSPLSSYFSKIVLECEYSKTCWSSLAILSGSDWKESWIKKLENYEDFPPEEITDDVYTLMDRCFVLKSKCQKFDHLLNGLVSKLCVESEIINNSLFNTFQFKKMIKKVEMLSIVHSAFISAVLTKDFPDLDFLLSLIDRMKTPTSTRVSPLVRLSALRFEMFVSTKKPSPSEIFSTCYHLTDESLLFFLYYHSLHKYFISEANFALFIDKLVSNDHLDEAVDLFLVSEVIEIDIDVYSKILTRDSWKKMCIHIFKTRHDVISPFLEFCKSVPNDYSVFPDECALIFLADQCHQNGHYHSEFLLMFRNIHIPTQNLYERLVRSWKAIPSNLVKLEIMKNNFPPFGDQFDESNAKDVINLLDGFLVECMEFPNCYDTKIELIIAVMTEFRNCDRDIMECDQATEISMKKWPKMVLEAKIQDKPKSSYRKVLKSVIRLFPSNMNTFSTFLSLAKDYNLDFEVKKEILVEFIPQYERWHLNFPRLHTFSEFVVFLAFIDGLLGDVFSSDRVFIGKIIRLCMLILDVHLFDNPLEAKLPDCVEILSKKWPKLLLQAEMAGNPDKSVDDILEYIHCVFPHISEVYLTWMEIALEKNLAFETKKYFVTEYIHLYKSETLDADDCACDDPGPSDLIEFIPFLDEFCEKLDSSFKHVSKTLIKDFADFLQDMDLYEQLLEQVLKDETVKNILTVKWPRLLLDFEVDGQDMYISFERVQLLFPNTVDFFSECLKITKEKKQMWILHLIETLEDEDFIKLVPVLDMTIETPESSDSFDFMIGFIRKCLFHINENNISFTQDDVLCKKWVQILFEVEISGKEQKSPLVILDSILELLQNKMDVFKSLLTYLDTTETVDAKILLDMKLKTLSDSNYKHNFSDFIYLFQGMEKDAALSIVSDLYLENPSENVYLAFFEVFPNSKGAFLDMMKPRLKKADVTSENVALLIEMQFLGKITTSIARSGFYKHNDKTLVLTNLYKACIRVNMKESEFSRLFAHQYVSLFLSGINCSPWDTLIVEKDDNVHSLMLEILEGRYGKSLGLRLLGDYSAPNFPRTKKTNTHYKNYVEWLKNAQTWFNKFGQGDQFEMHLLEYCEHAKLAKNEKLANRIKNAFPKVFEDK